MIRVTTLFAATAGAAAHYYGGYLAKNSCELPGRWTGTNNLTSVDIVTCACGKTDRMEAAGLAVAIVATITALVAVVYSRRSALSATRSAMASEASAEAGRQIAAIETSRRDDEVRRAEEEQRRRLSAELSIRVVREVTLETAETNLHAHFLEVGNAGPSDAWDVNLEIVSYWSDTGGVLPEFEDGGRHRRIGKIAPGRLERLALAIAENTNYDIGECKLRWRDDAGEHDERTQSLSDWLPRPSGFEG